MRHRYVRLIATIGSIVILGDVLPMAQLASGAATEAALLVIQRRGSR
jgi:hypothetical protein